MRHGLQLSGQPYVSRNPTSGSPPASTKTKLLGHLDLHYLAVLHHEEKGAEVDLAQDLQDLLHDTPLLFGERIEVYVLLLLGHVRHDNAPSLSFQWMSG
jgi:hypothetical protein